MDGENLMRSVVAAFAKSDLRPLLNARHEDVVWKSASRSADGTAQLSMPGQRVSGVAYSCPGSGASAPTAAAALAKAS